MHTIRSDSLTHRLLIVCAAVLLFVQLDVFACSTAGWSSVTGTPLALGVSTAPVGKKYEQDCALTVDAATVPSYVTTTEPDGEVAFFAQFYFLAETLDITSGDVTIFTARNGGTSELEIRLRDVSGANYLVAFYRHNGSLTEHPNPIALQSTWYGVQIAWSAGAGTGTFDLKLNEYDQYNRTDLVNGSATINEIDLGVVNPASAIGDVVVDAIELRRTTPPDAVPVHEMWNIATRADVRTVHEIAIGGFIISGDTKKCVVVRGRGPSVGVPQGVVRLPNPQIDLYSGQTVIASNDDWQNFPEAQTIQDLGYEPGDSLDSAIYICLDPGAYTVLLSGVGGGVGVGIVEVFGADVGTAFLENIATRAFVDTVHLVAIGGFIINGDVTREVLIRGRGKSVGVPEGVTRLDDPTLTLYDSGGTPIISNDNWQSAGNWGDIPVPLQPGDVSDSAILISLAPGAYTAILSGVGGVTGVGIVEVFDILGASIGPP